MTAPVYILGGYQIRLCQVAWSRQGQDISDMTCKKPREGVLDNARLDLTSARSRASMWAMPLGNCNASKPTWAPWWRK